MTAEELNGYTVKAILDEFVIPPLKQVVSDVGDLKSTAKSHDQRLGRIETNLEARRRWLAGRLTGLADLLVKLGVTGVCIVLGIHFFP